MRYKLRYIAALAVILSAAFARPASANVSENQEVTYAQQQWDGLARQMLVKLQTDSSYAKTAFNLSWRAQLHAHYYGWNSQPVKDLLNQIEAYKKSDGGYGFSYAWDAFQDKTTNPASTTYTVTVADHVGPTLIEGWKNGVVPASKITSTVDSLLKMPVQSTPNGYCMAYSNSGHDLPNNVGCVVNVSIGAAAYLQNVLDSGVLADDVARTQQVQVLIAKLKPLGMNTYNEAKGGWAYNYKNGSPVGHIPQDWNHNAYTFDSMITLYGQAQMQTGINNVLRTATYLDNGGKKDVRGTTGRLRMQSLSPLTYPENTWRDATYSVNNISKAGNHGNEEAQIGLWALRLAKANATETQKTVDWRETNSLDAVTGSLYVRTDTDANGNKIQIESPLTNGAKVKRGSIIILKTTAKSVAGVRNVYQTVQVIDKTGAQVGEKQKTTDAAGDVRLTIRDVTKNNCYRLVVKGGYTTTGLDKATPQFCVSIK